MLIGPGESWREKRRSSFRTLDYHLHPSRFCMTAGSMKGGADRHLGFATSNLAVLLMNIDASLGVVASAQNQASQVEHYLNLLRDD